MKPSVIAIDGSAASGKSTVAALLAQALGYLYFDTGVMYRAVTWAALDQKIDINDIEQVSNLAENLIIEVEPATQNDNRPYTVRADGRDITWDIRSAAVESAIGLVSSYPRVRAALTAQQRRIAAAGSIVMVGRDIGTVVLPQADLKIFMRASAEERARRRYRENITRGKSADYDEILRAIRERDRQDAEKPISPMVPASDAIIINTDGLCIEEVLSRVQQLVSNNSASK